MSIELKGGAYSAQIILDSINGEQLLEQPLHSTLTMNNSELGVMTSGKMKLKNLAVVEVNYFWHWSSKEFTISNPKGKMKPSELLEF